MVIPHQHRNCSFSIIYPVVIKISDLILGHLNGLFLKVSYLFPKKYNHMQFSWAWEKEGREAGVACGTGF